jgi:thioredoxin-related protein
MAEELRGSRTRFLLVTPAIRHVDQQTLVSAASLHTAESVALDLTTLRLKNVPTFVLVNQAGRVLYSREGYLDEDGSEAVRSAISRRQS